ncbi:Na+/H+ antiporter subunit B [Halomonas cerina]|uniref:Multicomponent Na+:H+ antiporter subunit B n=1 Tax=Halomonas cerina TaxID=447424 RepID=A0A839V781_9GAMM|nr:Na+/H+ antiporter subunit B [Halomonas cerina]MBB3191302.1 multicomponent Na+:H+ antiporter subunit B [Halomonas cerina]
MVKSSTLILGVAAQLLLPLQLLFSVFLLLRGHDAPGGGFIAGLVAAGGFALYLFAHGRRAMAAILKVAPRDLIGAGLLLGLLSVVPAWWQDEAFFTAQWWTLPFGIPLSTPLLFDLGVYLVVLGALLTAITALVEIDQVDNPH